jgi:tetratricopeptide (TPR) repeat protein
LIRHDAGQSAINKDSRNLRAHEYFLKGKNLYRLFTREGIDQARKTFEEGIKKYPDYPTLYPPLGWMHYWDLSNGWTTNPDHSVEEGLRLAQIAIDAPNATPEARFLGHWLIGKLSLWKYRDYQVALAEYDRAEAISPNEADLKASKAEILTWAGFPDKALESVRKAMRLNPHYPVWYSKWLVFALYGSVQYHEAIAVLIPIDKEWGDMVRWRAASYVKLGNVEAARSEIDKLLRINPEISLSHLKTVLPYENRSDMERELLDLRNAGLPE